ncbi:hypothetical protein Tco_1159115 [Tanacetum coccineum]
MIEADRLLAERLQAREQEELTDEEKAILFVELLEKRKKHFATLKAQEKRNKPPTLAQKKSTMSTYLKHIAGYKQSDELEQEFDKEDLENIWKLVKEKHGNTRPEEGYERVLWRDLKTMFEDMHVYMLVEKRYPLTPATITDMLNKKLKSDYWNAMCYQLLKLMIKQLKKQRSV